VNQSFNHFTRTKGTLEDHDGSSSMGQNHIQCFS